MKKEEIKVYELPAYFNELWYYEQIAGLKRIQKEGYTHVNDRVFTTSAARDYTIDEYIHGLETEWQGVYTALPDVQKLSYKQLNMFEGN